MGVKGHGQVVQISEINFRIFRGGGGGLDPTGGEDFEVKLGKFDQKKIIRKQFPIYFGIWGSKLFRSITLKNLLNSAK